MKLLICLTLMGFIHLSNGETYCGMHGCDTDKCLPYSYICDGERDCNDGSDEYNCGGEACRPGDFRCPNEACIAPDWLCDGQSDCSDGSDEKDCYTRSCGDGRFQCTGTNVCIDNSLVCDGTAYCFNASDETPEACDNKICPEGTRKCDGGLQCIPERWICNDVQDCDDGSDEVDCLPVSEGGEKEGECSSGRFKCSSSLECISKEYLCDEMKDCLDGSDEENCDYDFYDETKEPEICNSSTQMRCNSTGLCLPLSSRCDGVIQCEDASDESECLTCDPLTHFECGEGGGRICINVSMVCDGRKDCQMNEDESPAICNKTSDPCSKNNGGCSQICKVTPQGQPGCHCRSGYHLDDDDGVTCQDINECKIYGFCSQLCSNHLGGHKCSCINGYQPDPLNHGKCLAQGDEPSLIYAGGHDLWEVKVRSKSYKLLNGGLRPVRHMDIDISSSTIFWSDHHSDHTSRLFMKSSNSQSISLMSTPSKVIEGLAYDWVHGVLYWTEGGHNRIEALVLRGGTGQATRGSDWSVKVGGNVWKVVVVDNDLDHPKSIVVDPRYPKHHLYWSKCGLVPRIERSGLDGLNRQIIVDQDLGCPNGLTYDYEANRLYWTDQKLHSISSCDFDGRNKMIVLSSDVHLKHPFAITVFEDTMYWSDRHQGTILRSDKFNPNVSKVVNHPESPSDLRVHHALRQPKSKDICDGQCTYGCLASSNSDEFSCLCPTKTTTNGYAQLQTDHTPCYDYKDDDDDNFLTYVIVAIMVVVVAIILVVIFIYLMRRRWNKLNRHKISFQHPMVKHEGLTEVCSGEGSGQHKVSSFTPLTSMDSCEMSKDNSDDFGTSLFIMG